MQRDIRDVAQIEQVAIVPKLLSVLAEHSGQSVNYSGIGADKVDWKVLSGFYGTRRINEW